MYISKTLINRIHQYIIYSEKNIPDGPVPVLALKQIVETLYCILGLIRNQCSDFKMGRSVCS